MRTDLKTIHKFINDQKDKLIRDYPEFKDMPRIAIQTYSDMLECAQIGIEALVTREIADSDTFAGIPLKEAIEVILEYHERKSKQQMFH